MTPAMYFGVRRAVDVVNRDAALAGLLITGVGDVFIPGGDMSSSYDDNWTELGDVLNMDVTPFDAVRHSAKPVVSAINGIAFGGGMMIAMLSDVAVASDRATFRSPEIYRGIADTHYSQILPQQVGIAAPRSAVERPHAHRRRSVQWGVGGNVVPHDELMAAATQVLTECCWGAPEARREVKRAINLQYGIYDRMAMDASLRGDEYVEGWTSFSERRAPNWIPEDIRPEGRIWLSHSDIHRSVYV